MITLTLRSIKRDIKETPRLSSLSKPQLYGVLNTFMNSARKKPDQYKITPSSDAAIQKFINGLIQNVK